MSDDQVPRLIRRPMPNAVAYDLMTPGKVIITLPPGSTWTSGLHWHESHTEYLTLLHGSIRLRLGSADDERIVTAAPGHQPQIKIERNQWHEWRRASPDGDEVVVSETTDPADGQKAIFFWNLNGVLLNVPRIAGDSKTFIGKCPAAFQAALVDFWITLNLYVIFHYLDNIPVLFQFSPSFNLLDWVASRLILFLAAQLGWLMNARPVRLKYTPAKEYAEWMRTTQSGKSNKTE
ncbi:hypothetical protein VHEMI08628 [[Torrubiella] hemipterigena]|uniref:Cupin 2 conserved barrel domain-containing protein n=1 Tax=[Torrubiella] hemipterigena TaxID=1531966 RepID=A0A0A1TNT5_9HYPO|nr:hypothetical protein VHEMI08628 [[Torrubiella] hemipterigena]